MITTLSIKGLHCVSCKDVIEDIARSVAGIHSCNVSIEKGEAAVDHEDSDALIRFKKEVDALGPYTVSLS